MLRSILRLPLFLFVIVAVAWGYYVRQEWESTIKVSLEGQTAQAKAELERVKADVRKGEDYSNQLAQRLKEMQTLGEREQSMLGLFPRAPYIPEVLKDLANLADKTGLVFNAIAPKVERHKDFLVETPLDIKLQGTYVQMMSFLDAVANLKRVIRVEKLVLNTPILRGEATSLKSELTLVIFHMDDGAGKKAGG